MILPYSPMTLLTIETVKTVSRILRFLVHERRGREESPASCACCELRLGKSKGESISSWIDLQHRHHHVSSIDQPTHFNTILQVFFGGPTSSEVVCMCVYMLS
jgi:hypothetical protein